MTTLPNEPHPDDHNWWPRGIDPKDLPRFPGRRWDHVLVGDSYGGGHTLKALIHWMREGATAFPPHWGPDEIGEATAQALRKVAARENLALPRLLGTSSWHEALVDVSGRRLVVRVRLDWDVDKIVTTTHPLRGDGVRQVVNGVITERPLRPDER